MALKLFSVPAWQGWRFRQQSSNMSGGHLGAATPSGAGAAKGGEVIFSGNSNWSLVGRNAPRTTMYDGVTDAMLLGFHRLGALQGVRVSQVISGPLAAHSLVITEDGVLYVWGRNETSQLGLGHSLNCYNPTKLQIPGDSPVAGGAAGAGHTLVFTTAGELFAFGDNAAGQCGVGGGKEIKVPTRVHLTDVVSCAAGRDFSAAVTADGRLYTV